MYRSLSTASIPLHKCAPVKMRLPIVEARLVLIVMSYKLLTTQVLFFQAVIFVIDSSNRERLAEAQDELVKLLSEKELKDACLLILTNKQVQLSLNVKLFNVGCFKNVPY